MRALTTFLLAFLLLPVSASADELQGLEEVYPRFSGTVDFEQAWSSIGSYDWSGDGGADLVLGAPQCSELAGDAGCVAVFPFDGWPLPAQQGRDSSAMVVYGSSAGEAAGRSVSTQGDLDGDGRQELIIGASEYSGFRALGGRVGVFYGRSEGAWEPAYTMDQADVQLVGPTAVGRFGFALSSGQDFDGDGFDDLLVGARRHAGAASGSGGAFLVYGSSDLPGFVDLATSSTSDETALELQGQRFGDSVGWDVSLLGDVNGDGYPDLALGAPYRDGDLGPDHGRLYVVFGGPTRLPSPLQLEDADLIIDGAQPYELFGWSVSAVGDVNGDTLDDFAVGAFGHASPGPATGRVALFFGRPGGVPWPMEGTVEEMADVLIEGEVEVGYAGYDLTGVGDVNSDGIEDLLIGAHRSSVDGLEAGRAYLVHGRSSGWPSSLAGADLIFTGESPTDRSGQVVGSLHDPDGTGRTHLVVVASNHQAGGLGRGTAFVYGPGDSDGDGFCSGTECSHPALLPGDCAEGEPGAYPGAAEVPYDGVDQDCDGTDLDDVDEDGAIAVEAGGPDCNDEDALVGPGAEELACDGIDQDCDGTDLSDGDDDGWASVACGGGDCNDSDPFIHPGAPEAADGLDQDCDGVVDEETTAFDDDGDGFCEAATCIGGAAGGDCDDADELAFPGAVERVNSQDDDCDGATDEGTSVFDDDGDGWSELEGDCDDTDPSSHPGAEEVPGNAIDEDCDGLLSQGQDQFPSDLDGDGYCSGLALCADESDPGDCNDDDPSIYPGATEVPYDGIDQDCDGLDLADVDEDGETAVEAGGLDCNDNNPSVSTLRLEIDDGLDNDCDGSVDERAQTGNSAGCSSAPQSSSSPRPWLFLFVGFLFARRRKALL